MKNNITIHARAFNVTLEDMRTKDKSMDLLVLDKQQLQAAQIVGQSSKELICRMYNRRGYKVLDVGTAEKYPLTIDLTKLYRDNNISKL